MSYDKPDAFPYRSRGPLYPLTDLGELAVRLGSPVAFDRRGDVIWFDTFDSGIDAWFISDFGCSGSGCTVEWSAACPDVGGFSALVTTGDVVGGYMDMLRLLPRPVKSKIGFEVWSRFPTGTIPTFTISLRDPDEQRLGELRYDVNNDSLEYRDESGPFVPIATLNLSESMYQPFKLVVDYENMEYVRALAGGYSYDLSGKGLYLLGGGGSEEMYVNIRVDTAIANSRLVHMGRAVVTQNEP